MKLARRVLGGWVVGLAGLVGCVDSADGPSREAAVHTARQGLAAGPAERVKDVRTRQGFTLSSEPHDLVAVGERVFFRANDGRSGSEWWVSDGTEAGTRLVEDLRPGPEGSDPERWFVNPESRRAALDGVLYFVSAEAEESGGAELWRTDGTPEGTSRVADLCEGLCSASPEALTVMGGRLYFTTGSQGPWGLWRLDPALPEGSPERLVALKGQGWRIWPHALTRVDGGLYFLADDGSGTALWRSDGTEAGTARLDAGWSAPAAFTSPSGLKGSGGLLYFEGTDTSGGTELWRTDGTQAGTRRVADLFPGPGSSRPRMLTDVAGQLYFVAGDGVEAAVLWRTDGTPEGTVRVKAWPGEPADALPWSLTAVGSRLFFTRDDGVHGWELWTSDGTEAGTRLVEDLHPSPGTGSRPFALTALKDTLYFAAEVPNPTGGTLRALWRSDGTAEGTWQVLGGGGQGTFGRAVQLVAAGGSLFFPWSNSGGDELWKIDGTSGSASRVKDIAPPDVSSAPKELVAAGGKLFFDASDDTRTFTLWTSDGTDPGTVQVTDFDSLSWPTRPHHLKEAGGRLFFFTGPHGSSSSNFSQVLWSSDGKKAGTLQLRTFRFDAAAPAHEPSVAFNGRLFFVANDGTGGLEVWRTDGTVAGTRQMWDLRPGTAPSSPTGLTVMGNALYFIATEDGVRWALWRSDGLVGSPLVKVREFPSAPRGLTTDGTTLFFLAPDPANASQRRLWRSDGTNRGTVAMQDGPVAPFTGDIDLVANEGGVFFSAVYQGEPSLWVLNDALRLGARVWLGPMNGPGRKLGPLVKVGSRVHFVLNDERGAELWGHPGWTYFGDVEGPLKDIGPAYRSGAVRQPMFALEPEGLLLFAASDGASGVELWRTNGTRAGTWRVTDLAPGRLPSNPHAFTRLGDFVYFVADDGTVGAEPWRIPVAALLDSQPPTLTCPSPLTLEAVGPWGVAASYPAVSGTDDRAEVLDVRFLPDEGTALALGTTQVTVTGSDGTNHVSCTFPVTVVDTTAPTLGCPPDATAEATDASGASVSHPAPTASDAVSKPAVTYAPASGTHLPLGDTRVTVTAKDGAGNASTCAFTVTVRDSTAPALSCPAPLTAEALSASGAPVSFFATVADVVTAAPEVNYSPASGTVFPLGQTPVSVTARDAAGNASTCGFGVTVLDTTPPALRCPADVTVEATGAEGAPVLYAVAETSDAVTALPAVTYSRASGDTFALGTTPVEVQARDGAGNIASCRFAVLVMDTTAPDLDCPEDVRVEAAGPEGQPVEYASATVTDAVTASPTVTYSVASGDSFALGSTEVTVRATDAADNATSCAFRVTVSDTTAPVLTCPQDVTTEPAGPEGRAVDFPAATVTDAVTASPEVTSSHASGSTFLPGETRVSVQAKDAAGNPAACSFMVMVPLAPPAPDGGTGTPDDGGAQAPDDGGIQTPEDAGTQTPDAGDAGHGGPAPSIPVDGSGCGCAAGSGSASSGWGALLLLGFAARRRPVRRPSP